MQMNLSKILRKLLWHKKIHLTDGGTWEHMGERSIRIA